MWSTGFTTCCPRCRLRCRRGWTLAILTDRTTTIRASVADVEFELVLAVVLVVLVIYLFSTQCTGHHHSQSLVPLSLIGTFAIMYLANFSLNNLSLMALTIATGFVVDDAIVMIENISRYIELGEPPLEAALKGAGRSALRSFPDRLAHCGVDSAAVHAGRGRTPVS